jgi:hypothetical protein
VWLHSHFFPQPWHVALVIDPVANHGGFFWYTSDSPGRLHPQHYVGFFELLPKPGAPSIVSWRNMTAAEIQRRRARGAGPSEVSHFTGEFE